MLWRIEFFVEGKHLERALTGLTGVAINMTPPQPVANGVLVKGKGKHIQQESAAVTKVDRLSEYLGTIKGARINTTAMRDKWVEFGGAPASFNNVVANKLLEEKRVKRISKGQYVVL